MALLTPKTIRATRQWFADNAHACITEAQRGDVRVNDLPAYIAWREACARDALAGDYDHSLTFLQRATYIQTGDCPQSSCCAGSAPEARPAHADLVADSLLAENAQKYRTADGTEHQLTAKLREVAKAQRLYAEGRAIVRRKRGRYFSLEREACLDYVLMHGGEPAYC